MYVILPSESITTKEILRPVSEKGQVTIPVEIRKALGITRKGKVAFEIAGDEVKVKAAISPVDATHRVLPALKRKLTV
ncbi:MAG: AbrB/MazE/SpoVT family DNA-binding domain-containing protein [Actinobacteria bacterium]|nr:AbrB/MazE/SpoVT family DNA-binding domain-containing protein [Actinomycetota bacterium]